MYKHIRIILSHMYIVCCVQYTALDFTSGGCTGTYSNKYGVLRRKVAVSPGSPPHQRTLILDLSTRRKVRQEEPGTCNHMRNCAVPRLNTRVAVFTSP